jgi:hypothetical protein
MVGDAGGQRRGTEPGRGVYVAEFTSLPPCHNQHSYFISYLRSSARCRAMSDRASRVVGVAQIAP